MFDSLWPHGLHVARQASLSSTNSWSLLKLIVHWVGDAIQPSHPLSSPSPPAFNLSQHQGLFQWAGSSYQVAKYWSFRFSISPFYEYSGLISFRIDCFDLLAVKSTLKSLLQHHSSKASIFQCSAFFMVQLSHLYMTAEKTIALTIRTFASQVMSLGIEMGPLYWECRVLASEPIGKSTLWAFLRHVLTFSEAGLFTSLSLHPETFSLVQAYSSQKRFSLESAVSGSRMKFSTPFNF